MTSLMEAPAYLAVTALLIASGTSLISFSISMMVPFSSTSISYLRPWCFSSMSYMTLPFSVSFSAPGASAQPDRVRGRGLPMKRLRSACWALLTGVVAAPGVAAEPPAAAPQPAVLTRQDAVRFALANNPQLAVVREQRGLAAAGVV